MIKRATAFLFILWALGFAWFGLFLPRPLDDKRTDAVVVLTGGPKRIDRGLEVLARDWSPRMLIAGVDREVRPNELAAEYDIPEEEMACCISLGNESVDTRSNGMEVARWVARREVRSIRLITTDWHMRRARYEIANAIGDDDIVVYADPVVSEPSLKTLFLEYHKLILRHMAGLIGI